MSTPQFTGSDEELNDLVDAVGDAVNAQWQAPDGPKFEVLETAPFLAWRDAAVARALAESKRCACYRSPFDHEYGCPHAQFTHADVVYPMGKQFLDRDGARWAFYGENGKGEPLMKLFPCDDANEPGVLADVVEEYGPLTAVDPLPNEEPF